MGTKIIFKNKLVLYFISLCVPLSLSALTLEETIKRSLDTNPNILADKAAMGAAKEGVNVARAGYFPSVDVRSRGGYQYTRERSKLTPFSSSFNAEANRFSNNVDLTLSQLIFDGFLTINQVKQAKGQYHLSTKNVERSEEDIALQASQAFYSILNQHGLIRVAEEDIEAHQSILQKTTERVEGGIGTRADIEQVNARLSDAYVALTTVKGELERSVAEFMDVVGVYPKDLVETPLPLNKIPQTLEETLKTGFAVNPALLVAKKRLDVVMAQFDQTESPFWPDLRFETNVGELHNPLGAKSDTGTVSVFVVGTYNFYRGGGDTASRESQRNRVVEAKYDVATTQRTLERNIEQTWANRETASQRLKDLEYALKVKQQLVHDYSIQFDLGDRRLLDILDAERGYYLTKAEYVNTLTLLKISEAQLLSLIARLASSYKMDCKKKAP